MNELIKVIIMLIKSKVNFFAGLNYLFIISEIKIFICGLNYVEFTPTILLSDRREHLNRILFHNLTVAHFGFVLLRTVLALAIFVLEVVESYSAYY